MSDGPGSAAEGRGAAGDAGSRRSDTSGDRPRTGAEADAGFRQWISRPEVLVGLSALVLSLCGLFISIYETTLVRQEQRASVWPYLQLGTSFAEGTVRFWASNTGVGPARVRAVAVHHRGETESGWEDLIESVADEPVDFGGYTYSLLNGRVLPPDSDREPIFELEDEDVEAPEDLVGRLQQAILDGDVNVTACYCSVYEECWVSNLRTAEHGGPGETDPDAPAGSRRVESCQGAPRSGV